MQHYVVESNDALLSKLPVKFRVNCVLYKNYPADQLLPYLERFRKLPGASIQFRFDYTATTPENLYEEEGDKILQDLKKVARYTGLDGCRMRCGFHFDYKGMELTYHKTLPYSTIVETDPVSGVTYDILYDILIKQNGDIHSDWDGTVLDVDAYEKVYPTLCKHADGYPTVEQLRKVTCTGQTGYGLADTGEGKSTDGSRLILSALQKVDSRPLWIALWGGSNTLAQALMDARKELSPAEFNKIVKNSDKKLFLYKFL